MVAPGFEAAWASYQQAYNLSLVVPDVVRGEILFHQVKEARAAIKEASAHLHAVPNSQTVYTGTVLPISKVHQGGEFRSLACTDGSESRAATAKHRLGRAERPDPVSSQFSDMRGWTVRAVGDGH